MFRLDLFISNYVHVLFINISDGREEERKNEQKRLLAS